MLFRGRRTPIRLDRGGFVAWPTMPGWVDPESRDHGLGPLAMVIRSVLDPGRIIALHEHRNDEIISWVPAGVMRHDDPLHGRLLVDRDHLMVMNAGSSIWHSEQTLPTDPRLDMLQIMVRPRAADLDPGVQHGPIARAPRNVWRHLVGPQAGDAPFFVRNDVDLFDIRLDAGAQVEFPARQGRQLWFYVFQGALAAGGQAFAQGEHGLWRGGGALPLTATEPGIAVAFLVNRDAPVVRKGTVGDSRRIPPALVFRAWQTWNDWRRLWQGSRRDVQEDRQGLPF